MAEVSVRLRGWREPGDDPDDDANKDDECNGEHGDRYEARPRPEPQRPRAAPALGTLDGLLGAHGRRGAFDTLRSLERKSGRIGFR